MMSRCELGHHGGNVPLKPSSKYNLTNNTALVLLGKIVNSADTDDTGSSQEGAGLEAVAERLPVIWAIR